FKLKRKGADGQMAAVDVDLLDLPYDFDSLQQAGSMSGSGAIIVMDDTTDIVEALSNIAEFYAHESCGQCTPCREGSLWMAKALHRLAHGHRRKPPALKNECPSSMSISAYWCSSIQMSTNRFTFMASTPAARAARRSLSRTAGSSVSSSVTFPASARSKARSSGIFRTSSRPR